MLDAYVTAKSGDPTGALRTIAGADGIAEVVPTMTDVVRNLRAVLADRYHVDRELGRGGMATVYLAEDVRHHRKVAIKVLHPELSAVIGSERFLKEIELTASLQHPHILPTRVARRRAVLDAHSLRALRADAHAQSG